MSRHWWWMIAYVCAAGLIVGYLVRPFVFPSVRVALHPRSIQFKEGHFEGEPLEAHFELCNESRSPIVVTSLSSTCGCMAPSIRQGKVKTPFSLPAGASVPVSVSINTITRVGRQTFALRVVAEGARGSPLETRADVRVNLAGTLRADRQTLIFQGANPGAPLTAQIQLADMLPDPGVAIREVRTTNAKILHAELVPASGPSAIFGDKVDAKSRATLKISYSPDATEGRIQEMITIVPEDSRFPTLQIPVFCEMAEPPMRLIPSGLTLSAGAGNAFRRTVVLQSESPIASASVIQCPSGVKVEIGESSECEKKLVVEGDISQLDSNGSEILFAVNGSELKFPIRVLP